MGLLAWLGLSQMAWPAALGLRLRMPYDVLGAFKVCASNCRTMILGHAALAVKDVACHSAGDVQDCCP